MGEEMSDGCFACGDTECEECDGIGVMWVETGPDDPSCTPTPCLTCDGEGYV